MDILQPIIERANANFVIAEGDYEQDGLIWCGKCKTPKQSMIPNFREPGKSMIAASQCRCAVEEYNRKQEAAKREQERIRIDSLPIQTINYRSSIREMTFDADDGGNPDAIKKARTYVEKWETAYANNLGLLLWGNTGNGKTFAAACIANALMEKGESVMTTSFAKLLSAFTGLPGEERIRWLNSLHKFKLLVIDDLGVERESSYSLEQVYSVVDARYKDGQPLIVTTNLTLEELKKARNMDYQRIYDRVLEMCMPVHFQGASRRKEKAAEKMQKARALFGGEAG